MKAILIVAVTLSLLHFSCKKEEVVDDPISQDSSALEVIDEQKLLELVNEVRAQGCSCGVYYMEPTGTLKWNDTLELAAANHSLDMYTNDYFSHYGLDSASLRDRLDAVGYYGIIYGENISYGNSEVEHVISSWLSSEIHCQNIMWPDYDDIGVAKAGRYWTMDFGAYNFN